MPTATIPSHRYNAAIADDIETRWQAAWKSQHAFRTPNPGDKQFDANARRFYCLDMFPYPSGAGLHVGHPIGYLGGDILSRFHRMQGDNVLHPMGWDAFGLPAEQYAIQTGVHPRVTTVTAIDTYRRQLQRFGFSYDWDREIATIDEDYYRWTQWIWLQAWNAWYDEDASQARPIDELIALLENGDASIDLEGNVVRCAPNDVHQHWVDLNDAAKRQVLDGQRLAYLAEQTVNWCPKLGTVLANEEVIDGRSERGGHPVIRRPLKQWMFRITAYADRLLAELDTLQWPDSTRSQQAEWIGRSEGAELTFAVDGRDEEVQVFTTRPDTLFGATFMVLAPEHPLVDNVLADPPRSCDTESLAAYVQQARNRSDIDRMVEQKDKTGVFTGLHARNGVTGKLMPVWVADYVLMGYGHGAIMAVPGHDDRDNAFAKRFELPIIEVVQQGTDNDDDGCFTGSGIAINSSSETLSIDGMPTNEAKAAVIAWAQSNGTGQGRIIYRLRDWLFSRQRYWGEPFPIVYTSDGAAWPVAAANLPVVLPNIDDYTPVESSDPQPLLGKATDWTETTAGEAGVDPSLLSADTPVRRETNTMPGWAGSCWYFLRYCDPNNDTALIDPEIEQYWMGPTDESAGGVDMYIGGAEHAVLHLLYARFWHKMLFDLGHVSSSEPFRTLFHQGMLTSFAWKRPDGSLVPIDEVDQEAQVETATGDKVERIIAKMSKSLRNVVNPDDVIADYGADTFRLYEMYMGPLDASKPWNTRDIVGVYRFLQRAWRLVVNEDSRALMVRQEPDADTERALHRMIAKVTSDIPRLAFNTAIAAMIEFVNTATQAGGLTSDQLDRFSRVLCPFAPHVAEEFRSLLQLDGLCSLAPWPIWDDTMLIDDSIELPVQIKGKVRGRVVVPSDADADEIKRIALADEHISSLLEGASPRNVIVVPGKIINIIP